MAIVVLLLLINLYVLKKYEIYRGWRYINKFYLLNLIIILVLFLFHMWEINYFYPDNIFPFLDEMFFFQEGKYLSFDNLLDNFLDTYVLYLIFVKATIATGPAILLKVINIFVLSLLIIFLYIKYNRNDYLLLFFPLFLVYLYFLSYMNMRDTWILLFSFLLLNGITSLKKSNLVWTVLIALGLWMLRPMFVVLILGSYGAALFVKGNIKYKILSIITILLIVFVFYDFLVTQYGHYTSKVAGSNVDKRIELLNVQEKLTPVSYLIAFVKQFTTPLPTSKLNQMIFHGHSDNLYMIEISRVIMHTMFYFLIIFTVVHFRSFKIFLSSSLFNQMFFWFALANSVVYTFYRMGSGSSRNKVLPIILLFVFFVQYYKWKKQYKEHLTFKEFLVTNVAILE